VSLIKSGYVCAGFETLSSLLIRFINGQSTTIESRFDDHFNDEKISNMLSKTITGFLHSFGQDFPGRKKYAKYVDKEYNVFKLAHEEKFINKNLLYADSGGFQASIGVIAKNETELLIELYHEFLHKTYPLLDRAFVLDLPPAPECLIFNNWDDVYRYNSMTYNMAANLPDEIREKMIYIHHFRTPMQLKIFNKIKNENNLFDKFNYFATGGIVSNSKGDVTIPCIIYVIPLVYLINDCIKYKRKSLEFHILGGANFRDMLFYEMFSIHVKKIHDIDLTITFDSSGLYKALMQGRVVYILDESSKTIKKTDIRSNKMNMRFYNNDIYTYEYILNKLNIMAEKFNFKKLDYLDNLYTDETNTLWDEVRAYLMLYMLYFYSEVQTVIHEYVYGGIYDLYTNGMISEFNESNVNFVKYLTGKNTKKQILKSKLIAKSLDILTTLDEDYCEYLVNTFLAKDEIIKLNSNYKEILF